jgi:hypothetical protein
MGAPEYEGVAEKPLRSPLASMSPRAQRHALSDLRCSQPIPSPAESNCADICHLAVSTKRARAFGVPP